MHKVAELPAPEVVFEQPFYFLRHGETTYNREGRFQGQRDTPLSELGEEQALAAAKVLAQEPIKRLIASPLQRARVTAEAVAARTGLAIETDPELMECHLGVHQGNLYEPWLPDYWAGRYRPEGGEDFWQFRARVLPALARAAALGPDCLIVAHGGLWLAARSVFRLEPDIKAMPNALPLRVVPDGRTWQVQSLG
ncbi:MAG: histidine phosphatase family protein [Pseudomonadota bacterium]